tara:strand:+ start:8156 stop:11395 length:3240 start_codon:yes stop_codon:yes gene_type:complete
MGKTQTMMNGMMKGFMLLGGATGIGRLITGSVKSADALQKLGIKLGTTTEFLSKLQYASGIAGVEFSATAKALEKIQKSANDAQRGLSTAKDGFETLGISVETFINLSPEEQFQLMIEKLGGVANQSIRTGTAMDLMGRSGSEMLKIVAGGPEVFNELMLKAEDLGGVLKQDVADGAAAVADSFHDAATTWSGLLRDAVLSASALMKSLGANLVSAANFVREWAKELKFLAVVLIELMVIKKITTLIIALSGAMKVATFSARALGVSMLAAFGGIPGLIAIAVTGIMMYTDEVAWAVNKLGQLTGVSNDLMRDMKNLPLTLAGLMVSFVAQIEKGWNRVTFGFDIAVLKMKKIWTGFQMWIVRQAHKMMMDIAITLADAGLDKAAAKVMDAVGALTGTFNGLKDGQAHTRREIQKTTSALEKANGRVDALATEAIRLINTKKELTKESKEVVKVIVEETKELKKLTKEIGECTKEYKHLWNGVFDLDKLLEKPTVHQAEKEWVAMEKTLSAADQAMAAFETTVKDTQFESDILIDKMEVLDQLFQDGAIDGDTYKATLDDLSAAMGDAGEETVMLTQEVTELQSAWEKMVDGIDTAWTDMWVGLFKGDGIDSVKDFLGKVKDLFLQTLGEIAAEWTKKKLIEIITGGSGGGSLLGSLFGKVAGGAGTSAGTSAGGSIISKILGSIFGKGTTSTGVLATFPGAGIATPAGGMTGAMYGGTAAGTAAGTTAGTTAGTAGFSWGSLAGIGVPLAIAAFGFAKSAKFKKKLRGQFAEVISDPTIVANLATGPLAGGFKVLGQVGDQTFAQIGESAAKMFDNFSETSGGVFKDVGGSLGMLQFGLKEMKDEFGNVIVTATDFAGLLEHMEQMEPFVKQAEEIMATTTQMERMKENIDLVNSTLFRAKVAFEAMGESGQTALKNVDKSSQQFINIMDREFVAAVDYAAFGLENMGAMSSEMFEGMIDFANGATVEMLSLGRAAQNAINLTNQAGALAHGGGMQHGGSFIVGGGGGTDSQPVSFMATPGERVTVDTPNQARASGSDGGGIIKELRALRHDLAAVVAKPIVGAVTRGQLAMAGGARH